MEWRVTFIPKTFPTRVKSFPTGESWADYLPLKKKNEKRNSVKKPFFVVYLKFHIVPLLSYRDNLSRGKM
jgi:hypothetical protein